MSGGKPQDRPGARPSLDDLVNEAKGDFVPPPLDWAKIEAGLMPRVDREAKAQKAIEAYRGVRSRWVAVGIAVAAAASIPLFFARQSAAPLDAQVDEVADRAASAVRWKEPKAQITLTHAGASKDAVVVGVGESLARGDAIEVHGGRALLERSAPGGVAWALEDGGRVSVASAQGTLILALEKGAVEAQVAPVASGEAFAVDVGGARVAVHGTHLRVAQEGTRVVVDLREGVVSIGLPPRAGSTYGDLVTAPAHAEFDPADPHGSLKVTHEIGRVRAAGQVEAPFVDPSAPMRLGGGSPIAASPVSVGAPRAPTTAPAAAPAKPAASPLAAAPPAGAVEPAPVAAAPAVRPEQAITDAIRACARERQATLPPGVALTVTSRLELQVGEHGTVERAQFDPPLAPELRDCAARAIYATRFANGGGVNIPIDFTVP
jgi:hypothetical protein